MNSSFKSLIEEELKTFTKLNANILPPSASEHLIDILAQDYEKALANCLDYEIKNFSEFKLKCGFMFMIIKRDYDNIEDIDRIHKALFQDIENLKQSV